MEEPEVKFDPEDEVMAIKLYKRDPFCLEYAFAVESKFEMSDPQHLEQLNVIADIIGRYVEQSEKAVLRDALLSSRRLRGAQKSTMEDLKTEGSPN